MSIRLYVFFVALCGLFLFGPVTPSHAFVWPFINSDPLNRFCAEGPTITAARNALEAEIDRQSAGWTTNSFVIPPIHFIRENAAPQNRRYFACTFVEFYCPGSSIHDNPWCPR